MRRSLVAVHHSRRERLIAATAWGQPAARCAAHSRSRTPGVPHTSRSHTPRDPTRLTAPHTSPPHTLTAAHTLRTPRRPTHTAALHMSRSTHPRPTHPRVAQLHTRRPHTARTLAQRTPGHRAHAARGSAHPPTRAASDREHLALRFSIQRVGKLDLPTADCRTTWTIVSPDPYHAPGLSYGLIKYQRYLGKHR